MVPMGGEGGFLIIIENDYVYGWTQFVVRVLSLSKSDELKKWALRGNFEMKSSAWIFDDL